MKIRDLSLVKLGAVLFAVWILMVLFVCQPLSFFSESDNREDVQKRLTNAFIELHDLKQQNFHLRNILSDINNGLEGGVLTEDLLAKLKSKLDQAAGGASLKLEDGEKNLWIPSMEYEMKRRLISQGVQEWWYLISSELRKLNKALESSVPTLSNTVSSVLENSAQHQRALVWDLEDLSNMDHLSEWRAKEAGDLSLLIQNRIHHLQNPRNCSSAKKLVCNLNKSCGYGCQVHHAAYCFIVAYATQRTLILQSKNWRYNKGGWEQVFKPLSDSCVDVRGASKMQWPGTEDAQVIELPIIDMLSPRPPQLPLAIPKDISQRLRRLHGNPSVWWISQFIRYLLRYQPDTENMLASVGNKFGFEKPIVGVHIRRTDKVGTEAAFHSLEEYMSSVEEYYEMIEFKKGVTKRRVYLASDDPSVHSEAKQKYPNYEFIGDNSIAKDAAVATRYSDKSLRGVIIDIHFLAHSDFLVCTFSSQVCRLAYEIMQAFYPDASNKFRSLDDLYYYGGQAAHKQVAIYPHVPTRSDELELKVGDVVGIAGNHWDGYSKGTNERTKKNGLYPSFKAVDIVDQVDFPLYERS